MVVFPAPVCPTRAVVVPGSTKNEMPRSPRWLCVIRHIAEVQSNNIVRGLNRNESQSQNQFQNLPEQRDAAKSATRWLGCTCVCSS